LKRRRTGKAAGESALPFLAAILFALAACGSEESNPFSAPSVNGEGNLVLGGQVKLIRLYSSGEFSADSGEWSLTVLENGDLGSVLVSGQIIRGNLDLTLPGTIAEDRLPSETGFFSKIWSIVQGDEDHPVEMSNEVRGAALSVYVVPLGAQSGTPPGNYGLKNGGYSGNYDTDYTDTTVELVYAAAGTRVERAAFSVEQTVENTVYTVTFVETAFNLRRGWNFIQIQTRQTKSGGRGAVTVSVSAVPGLRDWVLYSR
jgi:hypothetical protein